MPDDLCYANKVINFLSREADALSDSLLRDGLPNAEIESLVRNVCLSSRSAFSEFRAMEIDQNPEVGSVGLRLQKIHERIISILEPRSSSLTDITNEFVFAMRSRLNHIENALTSKERSRLANVQPAMGS